MSTTWEQYVAEVTRGHNQEDVGSAIGVHGTTIGRWINGSSPAPRNPAYAAKLAVEYGGGDVIASFIAAGYVTAEEVGREADRPLRAVPSSALIQEIATRLDVPSSGRDVLDTDDESLVHRATETTPEG